MSLRSNSQNFFHFRLTLDDEEGRNGCYVPNPEGGFPFNTKVWFSAQTILGWCVHQWQWWVAECDWEQGQQGFSWDVPSTPRENPNVYYKAHHLLFVNLAELCAVDFFLELSQQQQCEKQLLGTKWLSLECKSTSSNPCKQNVIKTFLFNIQQCSAR